MSNSTTLANVKLLTTATLTTLVDNLAEKVDSVR